MANDINILLEQAKADLQSVRKQKRRLNDVHQSELNVLVAQETELETLIVDLEAFILFRSGG